MKNHTKLSSVELEEAGLAPSTRRAYLQDQRYFVATGGSLPATEEVVVAWLTKAAGALAYATIRRRLVAVHTWHKEADLPSPLQSARVKRVLAGVARTYGTGQRAVKPLVKDDLIAVVAAAQKQNPVRAARDTALLLLQFAAALRRSNLVEIRTEHLTLHDYGLDIYLPRSKTDQAGRGATVTVPFAAGEYCPVRAVSFWLAIADIESGFVFRAVDRHGNVGDAKLDLGSVCRIVKWAVQGAGLDPQDYSSHSPRAGFITTAAELGRPAHEIAITSLHKGLSSMQRYLRVVDRRRIRSVL